MRRLATPARLTTRIERTTALAIAIAESGSSLAATPLHLLADALEAATSQREALEAIQAAF